MAIANITVKIECRAKVYAKAVIFIGWLSVVLGADQDKACGWMARHAFKLTIH